MAAKMSSSTGNRRSPVPRGNNSISNSNSNSISNSISNSNNNNSNNDLKRNAASTSSGPASGSSPSPGIAGERSVSGKSRSMQVTSDEINILVYRYLQEAGFVHSAFTFAYESMIGKSNASRSSIPPGALISFLQKGLQYVGIEETLRQSQDGTDRKNTSGMNGTANANANANIDSNVNSNTNGNRSQVQVQDADLDFSLLCPSSIKSLIRKNPPIRLDVPPAAAFAAFKAKLQSEAKAMESSSTLTSIGKENADGGSGSGSGSNAATNLTRQNGQLPTPQATQIQNPSYHNGAQVASEQTQTIDRVFGNGYTGVGVGVGVNVNVATANDKVIAAAALASFNSQGQQGKGQGQASAMDLENQLKSGAVISTSAGTGTNSTNVNAVHGFKVDPAVLAGQTQHPQNMDAMNSAAAAAAEQDSEIERVDMLTRASPDEVLELNKHTSEVFMCAWNPIFTDLLATGSGDASARIWQMGGKNAKGGSGICRLLQHGSNSTDIRNKDVTTLEWSSNGELLATGSYDGVARVWERTGANVHTLRGHVGPIFSLKWNKRGNYLLSGSYDKTTIVWDISGDTGVIKQQFNHHTAPALDVDWKDDVTFASCSTDKTVLICRVGSQKPLHKFTGHQDEVNAVKWDPTGTLLASCSDDSTAKVWDISKGSSNPLHDFTSHKQEIYTVKWSPTGPGSKNPTKPPMLATASFDGSVRLWNVQTGACISILSRHRDSVYSVAFSPSGDYLASGSLAGQLYVWRVKDGQHIKSFKGKGDIFEVAWNKEETRIAACFSSNVVNVIDFKAIDFK